MQYQRYPQAEIPAIAIKAYKSGDTETLANAFDSLHTSSALPSPVLEKIFDYSKLLLQNDNHTQQALSVLTIGLQTDSIEDKEQAIDLILQNALRIKLKGVAAIFLHHAYEETNSETKKITALNAMLCVADDASAAITKIETYDFILESKCDAPIIKERAATSLISLVNSLDNKESFIVPVAKAQEFVDKKSEAYSQSKKILGNRRAKRLLKKKNGILRTLIL